MAFPMASAPPADGRVIVEWKAGKCTYNQTAKRVTPDVRKGLLRLLTADDGITHVQWLPRGNPNPQAEDDFMCFEDAYLEKISHVKDGRAYILKFTSSQDRKFFIWQQEGDETKDAEFVKKFNDHINAAGRPDAGTSTDTPMTAAGNGTASTAPAGGNNAMNETIQQLLAQGGANLPPDQLAQLTAMLTAAGNQGGAAAPAAAGAGNAAALAQAAQSRVAVGLHKMIKKDDLLSLMQNDEAKKELMDMLPGTKDSAELESMLRSVQLSGALSSLTQAVYQGSNALLFASLQLDNAFITPGNEKFEPEPMKALCKALEAKHKSGDVTMA